MARMIEKERLPWLLVTAHLIHAACLWLGQELEASSQEPAT